MIPEALADYLRIRDWRHAIALMLLGCVTLAALSALGVWLNLRPAAASMLYLTVVVLLSMAGSVTPAVILAIIASGCLDYFFLEPRFSLAIDHPEDAISVVVLVFAGVLIATLVQRARRLGEAAALREQLQLVIDTIPAVVWSNLPDGSTEFFNQRFREYSGMVPAAGRALTWFDILHPEDRTGESWEVAFAAGTPFEKEARMRGADGSYRRFLLRFAPVRDRRGETAKWYAASTDIEDLKRTEEELRQREIYLREAQAELAHVNRVTTAGELAASIAHEVAQPVAASVTNANAALRWLRAEPPQLDEVGQAVGRIVRDGRRASEILGRIRALVRKAPQRKDRLDLNEVIVDVLALTRAELRRHRIVGRTRLAAELPIVLGDRVQLQQVLLNLILNAAEATSGTDDEPRELEIASAAEADAVCVAVSDTGPGLPSDSLTRVFDAFYTTKLSGMGMGLSICRSIVEAHGGKLWATANEPRGAVFQFTVPIGAETAP
jgi:PAS domain S-box-containing protein